MSTSRLLNDSPLLDCCQVGSIHSARGQTALYDPPLLFCPRIEVRVALALKERLRRLAVNVVKECRV